jgi:hypothetical protein
MAAKKSSTSSQSKFSIELGPMDLSDEEINSIRNEITKSLVNKVRKKGGVSSKERREPYVKITFGKAIPHPFSKAIREVE